MSDIADREGAQRSDAESVPGDVPVTDDLGVDRILADFVARVRASTNTSDEEGNPVGDEEGEWISGQVLAAGEAHRQLQARLSAGRG